MSAQPLPAEMLLECLALDIRLVREFPSHIQAPEIRIELDRVKTARPTLYRMAQTLADEEPEKDPS